jgi:predicted O-linked N-acetylglucosamine transferase (SPINDLY family)
MSDNEVAGLIRKDMIDILIDLAGHTAYNRILLFARKPAPLQISWIGYPGTTGLKAMDYKIVDNYTDPIGMTEKFYTEKLLRLPESFLCYQQDKDTPGITELPAIAVGHVTFGSFNNFSKVSSEAIALWSGILRTIPDSRLIMKTKSLSDENTRNQTVEKFLREGISTDRIDLLSWEPTLKGHLEIYNRIDIALDTFPYNGTTTTCEALWMGVPVISLAGSSHISRVGVSLLSNAGIPEFIARSADEYADIAIKLTQDLSRLKMLRGNLRHMLSQSPLCNTKRFMANLEQCYRIVWENWCNTINS